MKTTGLLDYEAPLVSIVEIEVEQGFAVSDPESIPYGDNGNN